jgi:hypothetical protein
MKFYIDFDEDKEVGAYQGIYPVGECDFSLVIGSTIKKLELDENGHMVFEVEPDTSRLTREDKKIYWDTVCDCLVEVFGYSEEETVNMTDRLSAVIDDEDSDLFYHNEPLHVAQNLAGIENKDLTEAQCKQYVDTIQGRYW